MIETYLLDDREITLIGTAHVSKKSAELVTASIHEIKPDTVCIELCEKRLDAFQNSESWKKMDIFRILKEKKSSFLLGQLFLSSFYKRIGKAIGVEPGAEFRAAIDAAKECSAELVLSDRALEITLKRVSRNLTLFQKVKALSALLTSLFSMEEFSEEMIEKIKEEGELKSALDSFSESFPAAKKALIDERDIYLAEKIRKAPGKKIVAVVGAGHVKGILSHITTENALSPLEAVPPASLFSRSLKWILPAAILALMLFLFLKQGSAAAAESLWIWTISHALLSFLFALAAFAHPLAALLGALLSPLTALNPLIAAGWFAGIAQAYLMRPTVGDLERMSEEISSFSGFWKNRATRVLLVVVFTNLGSSLATFISGAWIFTSLFS